MQFKIICLSTFFDIYHQWFLVLICFTRLTSSVFKTFIKSQRWGCILSSYCDESALKRSYIFVVYCLVLLNIRYQCEDETCLGTLALVDLNEGNCVKVNTEHFIIHRFYEDQAMVIALSVFLTCVVNLLQMPSIFTCAVNNLGDPDSNDWSHQHPNVNEFFVTYNFTFNCLGRKIFKYFHARSCLLIFSRNLAYILSRKVVNFTRLKRAFHSPFLQDQEASVFECLGFNSP